ncbi:HPP family protein [Halalkalibacter alkalisediminis]|uniref:HPP family protein n=1 Tax=Halalkalibacter alkalisediminis TaxID=935616 RepID=A0ABV6NCE3_9BACI|nr:HPP family protein [Halalkalibacter alkalisediminis]
MSLERGELKKPADMEKSWSLTHYIRKMKSVSVNDHSVGITDSLVSAGGGLIAMTMISFLAVSLGYPMALGPIGASCLLVFAAHEGPFSQPRHIIGGHFLSTVAALSIWDLFGRSHITIGITLAIVVLLMIITKMMHPPAAASAIVAINSQAGWGLLLTIVLSAFIVVGISVLYNNLFESRNYPKRWV